MSEKKKVIVFTTGGTIAMKFDPKVNGLVPAVSGADLAAAVPGLDKLADVEVREFSNHASCAMTPQKMFQLSQMIEEALKEEGIYDDCAIFFLSDHGDFTGDFDLPE